MKIVEITNQIRLAISNEESDVLDLFDQTLYLDKNDFSDREQLIANTLVNKGVLSRKNIDGKIKYRKLIKD